MSVEITTLPSGLRVVTDRMDHLETVSLGVWVGAGSRHERSIEHGLSHLLEHMAFKGTRRRSARDIAEEIESAGGDLNAATSTEQTAYYAHVLGADAGIALDILADILTESIFDKQELEREKGVILQEIGAVEDTPDDLVFDLFNAAAFPGQAIGWPILGTPDRVKAFDPTMISAYMQSHYRSDVMVVGAARRRQPRGDRRGCGKTVCRSAGRRRRTVGFGPLCRRANLAETAVGTGPRNRRFRRRFLH